MSSRSLNEILIKIATELFDFIFLAYNLKGRYTHNSTAFIYRSIFAIPALRKGVSEVTPQLPF